MVLVKISLPSLSHSTKPIFLRFIVFFAVHLLIKVSNGETETELFWGSWSDQPVSVHLNLFLLTVNEMILVIIYITDHGLDE